MPLSIALFDTFTSTPFTGNAAGVCMLERKMPDEWMQGVAAEMNQSETAFLLKQGERYSLRWMTPAVEVDLCGHATLASAAYLYNEGIKGPIEFETRSGILTAEPRGEFIGLDFPAIYTEPVTPIADLSTMLGAKVVGVYRGKFDYLVELESEDVVRNLAPDIRALSTIEARGVVVTAQANTSSDFDFVSRGFFPQSGIDEDPVTGSAHCMLATFWEKRLGKTEMTGYQASKRGGYVQVNIQGDRVHLLGKAVMVLKGDLHI